MHVPTLYHRVRGNVGAFSQFCHVHEHTSMWIYVELGWHVSLTQKSEGPKTPLY